MHRFFRGLSGIYCCLLSWYWPTHLLPAQPLPVAAIRQQMLSPVDSSRRVVLTTGKLKPMFSWELAPGGCYALKFVPPAAGQFTLGSIRLYLHSFGRHTAQGQVRLRVVGIAADGSPADDQPLLPPRLITEQTLQALTQPPLALTWPATHLTVPATGFFVVLEGVGEAPDEYIIHSPNVVLAGKGYYQVGRRSQPDVVVRQLSTWSIPSIQGARRNDLAIEFWMRGGVAPVWRAFPESKQAPLVEVSLD